MNFKSIIVSTLLVGLVIISFIYFAANFAAENGTTISITDNPSINKAFTNLTKQLNESAVEKANASKTGFEAESSNPTLTALGFVFRSIVNAGTTFITMVITIFSIMFALPTEILHIDPIITGTIFAILIITLVLAIWRTIRAGE